MTRHIFFGTLAALALAGPSTAALAEEGFTGNNITISAPREQYLGKVHGTGARIVLYTVSVKVNIGDLDLRTEPGWQALRQRVNTASRQACATLDRKIVVETISSTCRTDATRNAMRVAGRLGAGPARADALVFAVGSN